MGILAECANKDFNLKDPKCQTCPENIACFINTKSSLEGCRLNDPKHHEAYCNICQYDDRTLCLKIKEVQRQREDGCKHFGNPASQPSLEKCLICKEDVFKSCEHTDLQFKNLGLSPSEVNQALENQLLELRTEDGKCFESFSFETACWEDCDYKVRCMRAGGIVPSEKCTYFPEEITLDRSITCENCNFSHICKEIYTLSLVEIKKEKEKKKLFQSFFSLGEIRNQFIEEE